MHFLTFYYGIGNRHPFVHFKGLSHLFLSLCCIRGVQLIPAFVLSLTRTTATALSNISPRQPQSKAIKFAREVTNAKDDERLRRQLSSDPFKQRTNYLTQQKRLSSLYFKILTQKSSSKVIGYAHLEPLHFDSNGLQRYVRINN